MNNEPYAASTILETARRQRREAIQAAELQPLPALLLPLTVALARLAARLDVKDDH